MSPDPTFASLLARGADTGGGLTLLDGGDRRTWRELHDEARRMAAVLRDGHVDPGGRIAFLAQPSATLLAAMQAAWVAGAGVTVLPQPPSKAPVELQVSSTRARLEHAQVGLVLVDDDAEPLARAASTVPVRRLGSLGRGASRLAPAATDRGLLQFTSGSTGEPTAVLVTAPHLRANVGAVVDHAGLTASDRFLTWLPLSHDMGLVGFCLLPMMLGAELFLAAPRWFATDPSRWMRAASDVGATITGAPSFAYALAARAGTEGVGSLRAMRLLFNGAEPVDILGARHFVDVFATRGLAAGAMFPVYGLAEATLAVTFPTPGSGLRVDSVDGAVLDATRIARPAAAGGRALARLGRPIGGTEIRILGETGELLPERVIGEVQVRGPSVVTDGTGATPDGWLGTGDLGYVAEGELVVSGRLKDVVIVGGRNHAAEDIERAAVRGLEDQLGVVAAFGSVIDGREHLVIVAEQRSAPVDTQAIARQVRETLGVRPHEVVLVEPGSIPRTTSGKVRRSACRTDYESGRWRRLPGG